MKKKDYILILSGSIVLQINGWSMSFKVFQLGVDSKGLLKLVQFFQSYFYLEKEIR